MAEVAMAIGEGPRVALGKEPTKIQLETRSKLFQSEDTDVEKIEEVDGKVSLVPEKEISPAAKKSRIELQKTRIATVHIPKDLPGPSSSRDALMKSTGLMLGQVAKGVMEGMTPIVKNMLEQIAPSVDAHESELFTTTSIK